MNERGFTMFEVIIVVAIISLLTTGYFAWQANAGVRDWFATLAATQTDEIARIAGAAQGHYADNHAWPDQAGGCGAAFSALGPRLAGMDERSPFGTPYHVRCASTGSEAITITNVLPQESYREWAVIVAAGLPGAGVTSRTGAGGQVSGWEVSSSWPVPAEIPLLQSLLAVDGSRRMTGDLDMGGNAIVSATAITAQNMALETGHSLANTVHFAGIVPHRVGSVLRRGIRKPTCPPGYTPQVFLAPVDVRHSSGRPITQFGLSARQHPTLADRWQVQSTVHDTATAETNHADVRALAFTKCSPPTLDPIYR